MEQALFRSVNLTVVALTAWRENRGGGAAGMQSVINVIVNRAAKDGVILYQECTRRLAPAVRPLAPSAPEECELTTAYRTIAQLLDPTGLWPVVGDPQMATALVLARDAIVGTLPDITGGATEYYAPRSIKSHKSYTLPDGTIVPFPEGWNPAVVRFTGEIAGQLFFKE